MVTVYPTIASLSTQASGSNGGQTLAISGTGFNAQNCSANVVRLQGVGCRVVACTATTLACVVGPAPGQPLGAGPYAGTRGLLHRVYWNAASYDLNSFISNAKYLSGQADVTRVQSDALWGYCVNCAYNYGQQLEGLFVPRTTGLHQFYISSDDASDLWLSTDQRPSNMARIAYCPYYSPTYWSNMATQVSAPLLLQAGKPYFIRARMAQGGGGDFLNVALRVVSPPGRSAAEVALHSVHERQTLAISTTVVREVQRINFTDASGSFMFYLTDFGPRSAVINVNFTTSTSTIANAIAVSECVERDLSEGCFPCAC